MSQWGYDKTIEGFGSFELFFLLDSISYMIYNIDTMKHEQKVIQLRKQINFQFKKLTELQTEMLSPKEMITASLIRRYLGTKEQKRVSPAFYISVFKNGRTILKHVSKRNLKLVENQVMVWKKYRQDLKRWQNLTRIIWQDLKQLGKMQDQLD